MESIKSDSSLSGEPSFNKMNQKDVFQVPIAFPKGTEFRGSYKGHFYHGKVSDGALMMNGKEFLSPNAAAITITRSDVDGWLFWDCKFPGASSWIDIYSLRQAK